MWENMFFMFYHTPLFFFIYVNSVNRGNIINTVSITCNGLFCHSIFPYLILPLALFFFTHQPRSRHFLFWCIYLFRFIFYVTSSIAITYTFINDYTSTYYRDLPYNSLAAFSSYYTFIPPYIMFLLPS